MILYMMWPSAKAPRRQYKDMMVRRSLVKQGNVQGEKGLNSVVTICCKANIIS